MLGLYDHHWKIQEVSDISRTTGNKPSSNYREFVCTVFAANLKSESSTVTGHPNGELVVIQKLRECPKYYPWKKGFDPKEHQQMLLTEESLKAQREATRDQRESDRRWQEEQRKSDRDWQLAQKASDRKWHWVGLAIAAGLGLISAILQFFIFNSGK